MSALERGDINEAEIELANAQKILNANPAFVSVGNSTSIINGIADKFEDCFIKAVFEDVDTNLVFGRNLIDVNILRILLSDSHYNENESENVKPLVNKKKFALLVGLIAVPLIAGMIIFYWGSQEPTVNILDDIILIEGMYGVSIDFYNVYDISLIDESMDSIGVGTRTNGFGGFGDSLKGDFTSGWLFVQSKSSPTIRIELAYERPSGKYIYISFRDSEATENLYREMTERVALDFVK